MEDRQAQDQCKEGTTLPLCDAKTSKNNYSERRKCATTLPGTVLDMSEWSSFNYTQGKTDTKTNFVVTISFTTKVDHQTTSKIWPDVWSCLMIDLGHETDGNNEICLGVCFALCLNHIHVLKWWTSWKSRPMLLEQLVHCTISSNRWPNLSRYVWFNYQIAAVHYPHWQGSVKKKNGTNTGKVSCSFELNSLDKRWHRLYKHWAVAESRKSKSMYLRRKSSLYHILQMFITIKSSSVVPCLPDQLNPKRLGSISDHRLPSAPQALKWLVLRKSSDYYSGSNSTIKIVQDERLWVWSAVLTVYSFFFHSL